MRDTVHASVSTPHGVAQSSGPADAGPRHRLTAAPASASSKGCYSSRLKRSRILELVLPK